MSGHSKWSKIKRQKASKDAKKGNQFTKMGNAISLAAREGGGDPDTNVSLRMAIEKAKEINMPNQTIERAIKKGTGELTENKTFDQISYEAVGKDGTAIIIDTFTDNKLRTISEIRHILAESGFSLSSGGATWQFAEKGSIILLPKKRVQASKRNRKDEVYEPVSSEDLMLEIMEIDGVEDVNAKMIESKDEVIEVITKRDALSRIYQALEDMRLKLIQGGLVKLPHNLISVEDKEKKRYKALLQLLRSHDDIVNVWTNINLQ